MNMYASAPARFDDLCEVVNARLSTYLINLDRSPERRLRMEARLTSTGLDFERISAVDGRTLYLPIPAFDEHGYRLRHGRRSNPFEIGCYLSHVACAQRMLESGAAHALILEDDLTFDADLIEVLDAALDSHRDWDILRLSTVNTGRKFKIQDLTSSRSLAVALTREKGSGAYIINRKAARWITKTLVPMRLPYDLAFDLEHLSALRAMFIEPVPVRQSAERTSLIQNGLSSLKLGRIRYASVLPFRIYYEASRFKARAIRLIASKLRSLATGG